MKVCNGARPYLLDSAGRPLVYPNLYLITHLQTKSYNSALVYMGSISRFEEFIRNQQIDVVSRLLSLSAPMEDEELRLLRFFLGLDKSSADLWLQGKLKLATVSFKTASYRGKRRSSEYNDWVQIKRYLFDFIVSKVAKLMPVSQRRALGSVLSSFEILFNAHIPSKRSLQQIYQVRALPPKAFFDLISLVIESPQLVFGNKSSGKLGRAWQRDRLAFLIAATTGCRAGELVNIRRRDILTEKGGDGEVCKIRIEDSRHVEQFSKRYKTPSYIGRNKRSGRSNRMVVIPQFLKQLIDEYIKGYFAESKKKGLQRHKKAMSSGFLFVKENGEPVISRFFLRDILRKIQSRAGEVLQKGYGNYAAKPDCHDLYPHILRHSRATTYMFEQYESSLEKGIAFDQELVEDRLRIFMGWGGR